MDLAADQRLLAAMEFAALAHKNQKRKAPNQDIPYVAHVFAVGFILSQAGYGANEIIAGFLHDVIEDTEYGYEDIKNRFGAEIADMVLGVTENGKLPWEQRKLAYIENLKGQNEKVLAISAADLLANRLSVLQALRSGYDYWQNLPTGIGKEKHFEIDDLRLAAIKSRLINAITEQLDKTIKEIRSLH